MQPIGLGSVGCVDDVIGAEAFCEIEAIVGEIHGNDGARAEHTSLHQETHAEWTNAQDYDSVIKAKRFIGKRRHLLGAVQANGYRKNLREDRDFRGQIIRHFHEKTSGNDVEILRPASKKIGRILRAQEIAVIQRILAATIRKVVAAVVAVAAGNIRADDDAVANVKWNAFEIGVLAIAADGRDRANIFVALDQRKLDLAFAILRGEALEGVLVRAADSRHLHFNQDAAWRGLRQGNSRSS